MLGTTFYPVSLGPERKHVFIIFFLHFFLFLFQHLIAAGTSSGIYPLETSRALRHTSLPRPTERPGPLGGLGLSAVGAPHPSHLGIFAPIPS